ncbi:MAG: xanthine dehydrogenase family protein molybdopterin-binding subunit, partial [Anaerorhabdus sp.]|uniref:xanthine dehydrogenase family protein molybdopterin-binding subunit n=1 Tax=Anaerorhabdus sp. TaxID=1872524 RepID=UPI003A84FE61
MGVKQFGARVNRLEDATLLTGQGRYVDDVAPPGTLVATFVRSPHAHARVNAIDTCVAADMPGVVAVLTARDLPGPAATERMPMLMPNAVISALRTQHCLAVDEVCFVGQTVAVIVADSRYAAEDAAARVDVDYDILPAVSDLKTALDPNAPPAHADLESNLASSFQMAYGDVDAAFAEASHIIDEDFFLHRGGGMAMETRGVLASYDKFSDLLTVWASTQTPHIARRMLADQLGINPERIRYTAQDVGGGFGPKAIYYPEETAIAAAAMLLAQPVKWTEDRREHFMCATQERDQFWTASIAVDSEGTIIGVKGTLLHDTGAFVPWGIIMPYIAAATVPGPYIIPS